MKKEIKNEGLKVDTKISNEEFNNMSDKEKYEYAMTTGNDVSDDFEAYCKAMEEDDYCYGYSDLIQEEIIESCLEDFEKFLKIECGCYNDEDEIIVNQLTVPKEVLFNNMDDDSLKFYYNATKNSFIIEMSNCIKFVVEAL